MILHTARFLKIAAASLAVFAAVSVVGQTHRKADRVGLATTSSASVSAATSASEPFDFSKLVDKARGGDATAQFKVGALFATGQNGVRKNMDVAMQWLGKSAEQNNADAQQYIGIIYGSGTLGKPDVARAVQWRELAAKNGGANIKWTLGNAYLFGYLVPKNPERAVYWIEEAAKLDHPLALVKIVEIYTKNGNAEKTFVWRKRFSELEVSAAENGNVDAMYSIGRKYLKGADGLPRNIISAVVWLKKAAEKGNITAMEILAKMYARGRYVPKNPERAREYFLKIVDKDPNYAMKISSLYALGKDGFPKDAQQSLFWLERAAENSDDTTRLYIAWRFWSGFNAPRDAALAVKWCEKCAPSNTAAAKMKRDILSGVPAPDSVGKYY